ARTAHREPRGQSPAGGPAAPRRSGARAVRLVQRTAARCAGDRGPGPPPDAGVRPWRPHAASGTTCCGRRWYAAPSECLTASWCRARPLRPGPRYHHETTSTLLLLCLLLCPTV